MTNVPGPLPPTVADRTLCERVWLGGHLEEHLDAVYNGSGDGSVLLRQLGESPLTYTKLALARAVGRTSRAAGRGGGTAAPGRLLLKLAPRAIARLAERLSDGVVLGNLSRDRLDGYGELEQLVELWRRMGSDAASAHVLVINADDPLLGGPGRVLDTAGTRAVTFGVADAAAGEPRPEHPHEAHSCAACGEPLDYARAFVGHLGHYCCPRCVRSCLAPDVEAVRIDERGLDGTGVTIALSRRVAIDAELGQPGLDNVHNVLAASAAAVASDRPGAIAAGLASTPAVRSREHITVGGHRHLCLAKNPAGVNATLRVLAGIGACIRSTSGSRSTTARGRAGRVVDLGL